MKIIFLVLTVCLIGSLDAHSKCGAQTCTPTSCLTWSFHGSNGPNNWGSLSGFSLCGNGARQSPINIDTHSAQHADIGDIRFGPRYFRNVQGTYSNDGNSAIFTPSDYTGLTITGGPYGNAQYQLAQFHFHYGCQDGHGSEHTINNQEYSLEMHLVHYNTAYGSFDNAKSQSDGLAVLGILFKARQRYDESYEELEDGTKAVKCIRQPGTTAPGRVKLGNFIKTVQSSRYYTYLGSLTTPGCLESVIWTVFPRVITIESEQMDDFRNLFDCQCGRLCDNYRPVQSVGSRVVRYNH